MKQFNTSESLYTQNCTTGLHTREDRMLSQIPGQREKDPGRSSKCIKQEKNRPLWMKRKEWNAEQFWSVLRK